MLQVRRDIAYQLNLPVGHSGPPGSCHTVLLQSFNRPNLYYELRKKEKKKCVDDISTWIRERHKGKSGIIYCLSIREVEEVTDKLNEAARGHNMRFAPYHSKLAADVKEQVAFCLRRGFARPA